MLLLINTPMGARSEEGMRRIRAISRRAARDPDVKRVNEALNALQAQNVIRVEYGGLRVLNLDALRSSIFLRLPR